MSADGVPKTQVPGSEPSLATQTASDALVEIIERAQRLLASFDDGRGTLTSENAFANLLRGRPEIGDESRLPIPVGGSRLVVFQVAHPGAGTELSSLLAGEGRPVKVIDDRRIACLVAAPVPRWEATDSERIARRCVTSASRFVPNLVAAISASLGDAIDLPIALRDASDTLQHFDDGTRRVLLVEDHWAELCVMRLGQQLRAALPHAHPLKQLEHAVGKDQIFAQTVATWLGNDRDYGRTSEALGIHVNTLRYRINKVRESHGLDLGDPHQRAVAQLWSLLRDPKPIE